MVDGASYLLKETTKYIVLLAGNGFNVPLVAELDEVFDSNVIDGCCGPDK